MEEGGLIFAGRWRKELGRLGLTGGGGNKAQSSSGYVEGKQSQLELQAQRMLRRKNVKVEGLVGVEDGCG